ncbi:DUF4113 domain-containing protein [Gluconobacter kanchanaburiensis]|uniref:DUF4113 domain-containing protein n=1 Tax=Gluconobacter kanchanaburiensis TaxID=563199 RepID=UPI0027D952FE|nr:DUF4113 domain-containing protein [Gluconobacter kanchanaburiensis]
MPASLWSPRQSLLSARYTTRLAEIVRAINRTSDQLVITSAYASSRSFERL